MTNFEYVAQSLSITCRYGICSKIYTKGTHNHSPCRCLIKISKWIRLASYLTIEQHSKTFEIRCVGLIWLPFFVRNFFSVVCLVYARLVVKNGPWQAYMSYNVIGQCAQNIESILGSIDSNNWVGLFDHLERERDSSLWPFIDFVYISTPIMKQEMIICMICNC